MANLQSLDAEERALVTFARLSMDVYVITYCERTHLIAREALERADALRREAARLRGQTDPAAWDRDLH